MTTDQKQLFLTSKPPKTGALFVVVSLVVCLVVAFFVLLGFLWVKLPMEGVKLHGTVDVGVDLLGTKNDLVWFGGFGLMVFLINMSLALILIKREKIASVYLISATGIVFLLLIGTMFFLLRLNRII